MVQACLYCTSNKRECTNHSQQSDIRLVCTVHVISVNILNTLNNGTSGLSVLFE